MNTLPTVLHVGRIYPQQDWALDSHVHTRDSEFVFVTAGTLEARLAGKTIVAHRGDILIYPSGVWHAERSVGDQPLETLFIAWMPSPNWSTSSFHGHDQHGRIEMLLRWMSELPVSEEGTGSQIRNTLFQAALYEFDQVQRPASDRLESRLRRYLQNHLAETLSLDDLAKAVGMTKYHFVRKFRELSGLPPMAYLRRMRVSAAETLLLNTALPLKAIAPQIGFSDEYHLSRVFRKENGLSPSQFRRERALAAERARGDESAD